MTLNRRDFAKLGALSLAARFAPTINAQTANSSSSGGRKIGYAVIGLGRIADHFMRGVLETTNSRITGASERPSRQG